MTCRPSLVAFGPVLWLCLACALPAQRQLQEFATRTLPFSSPQAAGTGEAVALADFNGDGALDLAVGKPSERNRLYLNDTRGYFVDVTVASLPDDADFTEAMAVADVDADGDLDLFFGSSRLLSGTGGRVRLYVNDGSGRFSDATVVRMPAGGQRMTSLATGDVDGDGDVDLVCGNSRFVGAGVLVQQNRLYLNDGSGFFGDATGQLPADSDDTQSVALGDVDGDGDLDLVCGNSDLSGGAGSAQNRLYLNDSTGRFTDVTAARMPVDADDTNAVVLGDVDGDGFLDLVCGNGDSLRAVAAVQNRLYLNTGEGVFWEPPAPGLPVDADDTQAVALADVDGDADLDIVLGNADVLAFGYSRRDRLYLNGGSGTFSDATGQLVSHTDHTFAIALGDIDGDAALDLVVGVAGAEHRLSINGGTGSFGNQAPPPSVTEQPMPMTPLDTQSVALGDLDGDGDADALIANHGPNVQLENDGTGWFADVTASRLPPDSAQSRSVALVDVDGDGDLDVVIGNQGQNYLYTNDGAGVFADVTSAQLPVDADETNGVAAGDVDGDGDSDLLVGNGVLPPSGVGEQNRLYLNDGAGSFTDVTASQLPVDGDQTRAVLLIDVDADGDLDAVVGNREQNRLYLNDGAGVFSDVTPSHFVPQVGETTASLAAGDVDGDGDPDLVVGNGFGLDQDDHLYFNDGTGVFTLATAGQIPTFSTSRSHAVALGDLDEDGDLDLYVTDIGNVPGYVRRAFGQDRVLLNDGAGTFTDVTSARLSGGRTNAEAVALGDLDLDGDLDVVVGNTEGERVVAYANVHRHLHAPLFPTLARSHDLEFFAKPGYAANDHSAVAVVSLALAPRPIVIPEFGTFYLDPGALFALPPVTIPQSAGKATQSLPIPADFALVGINLFVQAAVVDDLDPSDAHLTGHLAEMVRAY